MANYLTPDYLTTDFDTLKTRLQELLKKSDTFADYNFEGANITMLMELVAYHGDLSTYYTNLLAKNMNEDTANIYEAVHSIAKQKGYNPKGYVSAQTTLTVTVTGYNGKQILIEPWQSISTGLTTDDGDIIYYTLTDNAVINPSDVTILPLSTSASTVATFDIELREGVATTFTFTGDDIVDNQIILPKFNYDHGVYPYTTPSVELTVNGANLNSVPSEWTRVNDFYDNVSGITNSDISSDNVYKLTYDKYRRYVIEFSSSRNIPRSDDEITVKLLRTNGAKGSIGKNTITYDMLVDSSFVIKYNDDTDVQITSVTNSNIAQGASDPELIDDIKNNSRGYIQSQLRNITKADYISHLESRTDVVAANAWGEQEINPVSIGDDPLSTVKPSLYNKVFVSVVPPLASDTSTDFKTGTLSTKEVDWVLTDTTPTVSGSIRIPVDYDPTWKNTLITYLEPRKMINVYEILEIPEFIYFRFEIGLRIKRIYNFDIVKNDVLDKLNYYFNSNFRKFNETINFMDITNFIMDMSETSTTSDFDNIRGVNNLIFRDISIYSSKSGYIQTIQPYGSTIYPQFDRETYSYYENTLKGIKIGHNQFPILAKDLCTIINES